MRYALRNQHKISDAYGPEMLKRIVVSLDEYFGKERKELGAETWESDPRYPILTIPDAGHTTNDICFYVIGQQYDVAKLAFKEFIG